MSLREEITVRRQGLMAMIQSHEARIREAELRIEELSWVLERLPEDEFGISEPARFASAEPVVIKVGRRFIRGEVLQWFSEHPVLPTNPIDLADFLKCDVVSTTKGIAYGVTKGLVRPMPGGEYISTAPGEVTSYPIDVICDLHEPEKAEAAE